MAWFYTVLLAGCSAGLVVLGGVLTRRLFRDELLLGDDAADPGREGAA